MSAESPFLAEALHITRHYGTLRFGVARGAHGEEHVVLTAGDVRHGVDVICRIASECITGTAFDSAQCDCADQIHLALQEIASAGVGILIYLRQEGRGHGLVAKIRALNLKNSGMDTFAAVEALGLQADIREYEDAAIILRALDVQSIVLLTNNPDKRLKLEQAGITVTRVKPLKVPPTEHTAIHLEAKRRRGHTT